MLRRRQPPSCYKRNSKVAAKLSEFLKAQFSQSFQPAGGAVRPVAAKSRGLRVFVDVVAIKPDFANLGSRRPDFIPGHQRRTQSSKHKNPGAMETITKTNRT